MSITNWIFNNIVKRISGSSVFNGAPTLNDSAPLMPNWMYNANMGIPRGLNVIELRKYAKSCWVQMAVTTILKQVLTTDYGFEPIDPNEKIEEHQAEVDEIKNLLEHPNANGDSFRSLWWGFLKDVLEIDAGIIYKSRIGNKLKELYTFDSSSFLIQTDQHGLLDKYYQYSFRSPMSKPLPFEKENIVYGIFNKSNELYPYGFSPLETIQQEVELMIQSTKYNKEFFKNDATPSGMVIVPMEEALNSLFASLLFFSCLFSMSFLTFFILTQPSSFLFFSKAL